MDRLPCFAAALCARWYALRTAAAKRHVAREPEWSVAPQRACGCPWAAPCRGHAGVTNGKPDLADPSAEWYG